MTRYFQNYFTEKSALDEHAIMSDLSQELRVEITEYLIHPLVRHHFMFESLPPPVIARLVHVLEKAEYGPEAQAPLCGGEEQPKQKFHIGGNKSLVD